MQWIKEFETKIMAKTVVIFVMVKKRNPDMTIKFGRL